MAQLFISYHREYCSQPILVGDGALVDLANFIEGAVSALDALARLRRGPCRSPAVWRLSAALTHLTRPGCQRTTCAGEGAPSSKKHDFGVISAILLSRGSSVKNSTPLVSVGLFVYNGERFIEEALQSILNQTFTDFELIISDNASTDRTGEIAQAYAMRDDRIRYYRNEKNIGAGWNARRVYELATGKYFRWATADDLLEPDLLRRCVEILENDPDCVVAYARTREIDENGTFIRNYVAPAKADSSDPVLRFREMLLVLSYCYQIYGVMRMSALRQIPPQGIYANGDGVLLARMSLLGRFCEIPEPLFISRHHSAQSTSSLPIRLKRPRRFRLTNRYGILPAREWWDPTKTRALTFPEFRMFLEYFLSVYRAPLRAEEKLRCYSFLLPWIKIHYKRMVKDLLIAADQVLYNLQVAKSASTDLPQETNRPERTLS